MGGLRSRGRWPWRGEVDAHGRQMGRVPCNTAEQPKEFSSGVRAVSACEGSWRAGAAFGEPRGESRSALPAAEARRGPLVAVAACHSSAVGPAGAELPAVACCAAASVPRLDRRWEPSCKEPLAGSPRSLTKRCFSTRTVLSPRERSRKGLTSAATCSWSERGSATKAPLQSASVPRAPELLRVTVPGGELRSAARAV